MRMLWTAAVVGALALTGCQDRQSKVQDEQRDVAEAQREANKEIAEVRQEAAKDKAEIDQDVREETAEVRKDVADEQRDVRAAEYEGSGELAASGTLTGKLSDADSNSVTIEDDAGNKHDFQANESTRVSVGGRAAKLDDLKEGSQVRASYSTEGDEKVIREVTVTAAEVDNE